MPTHDVEDGSDEFLGDSPQLEDVVNHRPAYGVKCFREIDEAPVERCMRCSSDIEDCTEGHDMMHSASIRPETVLSREEMRVNAVAETMEQYQVEELRNVWHQRDAPPVCCEGKVTCAM
jgi:hypothetical protein